MATSQPHLNQLRKKLFIYVDNSSLWAQGQKAFARARSLNAPWDATWRCDVGQLKAVVVKNTSIRPETSSGAQTYLHGSGPPPVDTIWREILSQNVKPNTFTRSSSTHRGRTVDRSFLTDSQRHAAKAFYSGWQAECIFVSDDEDIYSAAIGIVDDYRFKVHVWSWKNSLSSVYNGTREGLVQMHCLDDHLETIGFRETSFRINRNVASAHSIVVLDPLSKADEIRDFTHGTCPTVFVYQYVTTETRAEASCQDLVIIPASQSIHCNAGAELFSLARTQLGRHGLSVLTYPEYCHKYYQHCSLDLQISNRFVELPEGEIRYGYSKKEANDAFVEANDRGRKASQGLTMNEQLASRRCHWRKYCNKELDCKYGYTKDEHALFRVFGHRKAKKVRPCLKKTCTRGEQCSFAHNVQELLCPTCDRVGTGHKMNQTAVEWLEKVFIPRTEPADPAERRLLVLDGHGSHETVDFMYLCYQHKIHLLFLPPHTSHVLQPLDLSVFPPLKHYYRKQVGIPQPIDRFEPGRQAKLLFLLSESTRASAHGVQHQGRLESDGVVAGVVAKPLLSPLLLENSNNRKKSGKKTPLDDDVPTKRLLFRKITKDFDDKDSLLAKAITYSGAGNIIGGHEAEEEEEEGGNEPEFEVRRH
ncbi:hypothetical protein Purlil1_12881 [Purpureocillium lilacinum]|uniref:DDE-1 domain-containing protein n=1 Tax=Purpureocillium lilacinum TaxID=33203 RepID=A0ABR0BFJ5_PURLI|nr:hypothetical protein Purlil1_12881 [Purpureocillium lilacinum]